MLVRLRQSRTSKQQRRLTGEDGHRVCSYAELRSHTGHKVLPGATRGRHGHDLTRPMAGGEKPDAHWLTADQLARVDKRLADKCHGRILIEPGQPGGSSPGSSQETLRASTAHTFSSASSRAATRPSHMHSPHQHPGSRSCAHDLGAQRVWPCGSPRAYAWQRCPPRVRA